MIFIQIVLRFIFLWADWNRSLSFHIPLSRFVVPYLSWNAVFILKKCRLSFFSLTSFSLSDCVSNSWLCHPEQRPKKGVKKSGLHLTLFRYPFSGGCGDAREDILCGRRFRSNPQMHDPLPGASFRYRRKPYSSVKNCGFNSARGSRSFDSSSSGP